MFDRPYYSFESVATTRSKVSRRRESQDDDNEATHIQIPPCSDEAAMPTPLHAVDVEESDYTSEIGNQFFYLLSEGAAVPSCFGPGTPFNMTPASLVRNGNTALLGIGHNKACSIWYSALTAHFSASMSFPEVRAITLKAARDLYGSGSTEYNAVADAWDAIQVT
jgi:hypothetical protein